ncbi:COP23 domain-containing protein [Waterburya agarophytonicola K14]|uniref:COP23 domain-containing protein n=1 Tax=Waterburya agarophytonicola KI4 TaxID=2874699 RepID=A0A964FFR6_9CYAN|nr:COP23 domain-containing protein [Waterburya agarophytonicola]MCC0178090.1 COP23 domain-containing protein [Waterburya agarophytonicola KI4]
MNLKYLSLVICGSIFVSSACSKENQADATNNNSERVTFSCGTSQLNGETVPATVVNNPKLPQPLTVIYFDPNNGYFGSEWTPQKRCEEVSQRFQAIYDRDSLGYITVDRAQWIRDGEVNVVCSTKKIDTRCEEDDLLFTLQTQDDPNEVLQDFMAFRQAPSKNQALTRSANKPTFEEGSRVYYDFADNLENAQSEEATEEDTTVF